MGSSCCSRDYDDESSYAVMVLHERFYITLYRCIQYGDINAFYFGANLGRLKGIVRRSKEIVEELTTDKVDLPLHVACRNQANLPLIQFLVKCSNSGLFWKEYDGDTALHEYCRNPDKMDLLELEQTHGFQHRRRRKRKIEVIRYLVEQNPLLLSETDDAGNLPLHCACDNLRHVSLEILQFLVKQHPASLHHRAAQDNETPLDIAEKYLKVISKPERKPVNKKWYREPTESEREETSQTTRNASLFAPNSEVQEMVEFLRKATQKTTADENDAEASPQAAGASSVTEDNATNTKTKTKFRQQTLGYSGFGGDD